MEINIYVYIHTHVVLAGYVSMCVCVNIKINCINHKDCFILL